MTILADEQRLVDPSGHGAKGSGLMGQRFWVFALPVVAVAAAAGAAWAMMAWQYPPGDPADPEQVADGAALYAWNCTRCHGEDLGGEFSWATEGTDLSDEEVEEIVRRLGDVAPAHDDRGSTSRLEDDMLFKIIDEGPEKVLDKPDSRMPGFSDRLDEEQIWAVIAFMKSHWQETDTAAASDEIEEN